MILLRHNLYLLGRDFLGIQFEFDKYIHLSNYCTS